MGLDNDTRGWIMTCISGVACVLGASIICIDIFIRLLPRMHDFSIAKSDAFLSASLSLSFGVMLFSALYSMLPQSKIYLEDGGFSPGNASFLLIGLFLAGVIGIQGLSSILHRFIPSHIVDCDHTHDEEEGKNSHEETSKHDDHHGHNHDHPAIKLNHEYLDEEDEETPLLSRTASLSPPKLRQSSAPEETRSRPQLGNALGADTTLKRPSLVPRTLTRTLSKYVGGRKDNCDDMGPCMGFSDPCGQNCLRAKQRRGSVLPGHSFRSSRNPSWKVCTSEIRLPPSDAEAGDSHKANGSTDISGANSSSRRASSTNVSKSTTNHHSHPSKHDLDPKKHDPPASVHSHAAGAEHHHHVPTNAFMAIGLQTSIAIALHKAPEGFITYATNHANPTLGFSVFMALFIHNITEGFAMSLPLYLALGSRLKAIIWSSFLGGLSQPIGAGVAALWFKVAEGTENGAPSEGVYGGMFAVTAGVMSTVALSLFSESLQLSHNKTICIAFAFLGMAILGVSFALTAK